MKTGFFLCGLVVAVAPQLLGFVRSWVRVSHLTVDGLKGWDWPHCFDYVNDVRYFLTPLLACPFSEGFEARPQSQLILAVRAIDGENCLIDL